VHLARVHEPVTYRNSTEESKMSRHSEYVPACVSEDPTNKKIVVIRKNALYFTVSEWYAWLITVSPSSHEMESARLLTKEHAKDLRQALDDYINN
jgi:hypothetical protein